MDNDWLGPNRLYDRLDEGCDDESHSKDGGHRDMARGMSSYWYCWLEFLKYLSKIAPSRRTVERSPDVVVGIERYSRSHGDAHQKIHAEELPIQG